MSRYLFRKLKLNKGGTCTKTMTLNTQVSLPENGLSGKKIHFRMDKVKKLINPIEMQWKDLKRAVHSRKPTIINELKQFCKEEWAKISNSSQCMGQINHYSNIIQLITAARGVKPDTKSKCSHTFSNKDNKCWIILLNKEINKKV